MEDLEHIKNVWFVVAKHFGGIENPHVRFGSVFINDEIVDGKPLGIVIGTDRDGYLYWNPITKANDFLALMLKFKTSIKFSKCSEPDAQTLTISLLYKNKKYHITKKNIKNKFLDYNMRWMTMELIASVYGE